MNSATASLAAGAPATLRDYQERAVASVRAAWATHRRVLLVAPTASGKTTMGANLVAGTPTVWIAHRRELVRQAAAALERAGAPNVGMILPGEPPRPYAPIQVATVQTLVARERRPAADLIVLDEAHHYASTEWRTLADAYPQARSLGLTATPERTDGRGLADLFDHLVVAAQYGRLITDGHIVPCRVYQSPEVMDSNELAQDPVGAYQRHGENSYTLAFTRDVEGAYRLAEQFNAAGIAAGVVEGTTATADRDDLLRRFGRSDDHGIRVLVNCQVLTEGVDLPVARCVLLARRVMHATPFLQIVGRVLRPCEGKPDAILIDLPGATHLHGLPTEDRRYVLRDDCGIERTSVPALRVCAKCGVTYLAAYRACPGCGYEPPRPWNAPTIYSLALREVYAGADTPGDAKRREWQRLRGLCIAKGWSLDWGVREYKKLFPDEQPDLTHDDKRLIYDGLRRRCAEKGYRPGWAAHRYRDAVGVWPRFGNEETA